MNLEKRIVEDWKTAFKAKETIKKNTLTLARATMQNSAKDSNKESLTDEEVVVVLRKMVKNQKQSNSFLKGEALEIGEQELSILESYLPHMLEPKQVESIVAALIFNSEEKLTKKDTGKLMGMAMKHLKGQADGNSVRKAVEKALSD